MQKRPLYTSHRNEVHIIFVVPLIQEKTWLLSSTECSSSVYHTYTVHSRKSLNKCINKCIMYCMKNVISLNLWAKQLSQCAHMGLLALPSHSISLFKTSIN